MSDNNVAQDEVFMQDKTYQSIYDLRRMFQRSGTRNDSSANKSFNQTDSPQNLYFRIFFEFNHGGLLDNSQADSNKWSPGEGNAVESLLPINNISEADRTVMNNAFSYTHNSAYNYLMMNNEFERGDLLLQFIKLLQNINQSSPWYFSEISGLETGFQRPELYSNDFKPVSDDRKSFTIKCLPDAFDNRIATLLELYRAICFSQTLHKVILPNNLRKFNMYIYIFNAPIRNMHRTTNVGLPWGSGKVFKTQESFEAATSYEIPENKYEQDLLGALSDHSSSKLIELRNCEINPDSSSSGYASLNNAEGFAQEFTIGIGYDSLYETRYNEVFQTVLGDFIKYDLMYNTDPDLDRSYKSDEVSKQRDVILANLKTKLDAFKYSINGKEYGAINNDYLTNTASIGDSVGATSLRKLGNKFGVTQMIDQGTMKYNDIVDRYNPLAATNQLLNGLSSNIVDVVGHQISKVVFGNIFYDEDNSLKGQVTKAIGEMQDKWGINGGTDSKINSNHSSQNSDEGKVSGNLYHSQTGSTKSGLGGAKNSQQEVLAGFSSQHHSSASSSLGDNLYQKWLQQMMTDAVEEGANIGENLADHDGNNWVPNSGEGDDLNKNLKDM